LETRLGGLQASRARLPVPAAALRVYPSGSFREMRFVPDRDALARARTSLDALARAMRGGCDGLVASRILEDGRPVPVRLRMADHGSWQEVLRYPVRSADGRLVEAAGLGRLEAVATVPALYRLDRQDACRISAPDLAGQALPEGGSRPAAGALQEQAGWFGLTILLILALLYLFLGAQLQSFTLPALLMLPIPLAFGGIFVALLAAGSSLNLDSILGIVVLFGVVINNSLMLYESFHRLRGLAGDAVRTVLAGSRQRLRPIVISVVITVGSLLPLALDKSGASSQSSMAVAIIGGLSVSTVLTLFVMPLVFLGHFRRRGHA
jgi:HAE1 family hydrophobic/amphiphilic exporter-1